MSNVHMLYAQHLLNGRGAVSSRGGTIMTFGSPMTGSGWFTDSLKSIYNSGKSFFNTHVKPVVIKHGSDVVNDLATASKGHLRNAVVRGLDDGLSVRELAQLARNDMRQDLGSIKQSQKKKIRDHLLNQLA